MMSSDQEPAKGLKGLRVGMANGLARSLATSDGSPSSVRPIHYLRAREDPVFEGFGMPVVLDASFCIRHDGRCRGYT